MKRTSSKHKKNSYIYAAATIALILVLIVLAYRYYRSSPNATVPTPSPTVASTKGNSVHDQPPSVSQDPTATPKPTIAPGGTLATKPTLQKSSGNAPGSSVPAGVMIEFTCEGTANLQCEVILTDRNNAKRVQYLGAKPIAGNGRGQFFAIWEWASIQGSWNVAAKMTDGSGNSSTSATQVLEVK